MGVWALPNLETRPGCESDQSPRLVPRVRMRGAIPLLPLYVFMARTATNLFILNLTNYTVITNLMH